MSWFTIFGGHVIFGGLRLCATSLDWQFACNSAYCNTFPDSTCDLSPSGVFASFYCATNTTTSVDFFNGCPSHEKYFVDYKFRQSYFTDDPRVNVSVIATFNCEEVVMEHNGTGLFVTVHDNTSQSGCPGFVASSSTSGLPSSTSSIPSSNSTTSASTLTSTFLTTKTYTITSCPPTVTSCPVGAVTTKVITSYTTFCPGTVTPTATPAASCPGCASSPTTNGTTIYSSQSIKSLIIPTSSPPAVQVSSGSSTRIPWVLAWYSAAPLLFSIPSVLGSLDIGANQPINHARDTYNLGAMPSPNLVKRIPVADFADIESFGTTLSATMESKLPTIPGKGASLLQNRIALLTNNICLAGTENRNLYGPNWTTTPDLKLLGHMLADCAKSMDQMDQDLLSFYTQAELDASPDGVLFLKFAGIMYCNRLIAPLVNDPGSLDGICGLVA